MLSAGKVVRFELSRVLAVKVLSAPGGREVWVVGLKLRRADAPLGVRAGGKCHVQGDALGTEIDEH